MTIKPIILTEPVSLTWKEFEQQFKPIKNHFSKDPDETMFETFGEEVEFVQKADNKNVWTWVSGDGCDLLVNGYAYVNRLSYYITEIPWDDSKDYEVIISTESECECYDEDREDNDGEYGDINCEECEGSGIVTNYAD